jgi:hypothetical protein
MLHLFIIPHVQTQSKYDKQDQQGKAAFIERTSHMTQQQEPAARSPGGPKPSLQFYVISL